MLATGTHFGEAYNFSYGLNLSVMDVVARVLQAMGRPEVRPRILNQATNEIPIQCLDSSKARAKLGWVPRFGFDEGLRRTIEWYRAMLSPSSRPSAR